MTLPKPRLPGGRLAFERAIRYSSLPAPARHLALTIATWADIESGMIPERFQPAQTTLEEATGLSRGSVFKFSKLLESEGWLIREGGGGRKHRTRHVLRIPVGAKTGASVNVSPDDMFTGNVSSGEQETCRETNGNVSSHDTKSPCSSDEYQPPSPPPPPEPAPDANPPTDGREGGGIAALDDKHRAAYDALLRITATDPRLTIGEREALELLALVIPWLERTTAEVLREALTAGLPTTVSSPKGLLRRRLLEKLPPQRASPQPAGDCLPPWCGACDGEELAMRWRETPTGAIRCPDCNPHARAA